MPEMTDRDVFEDALAQVRERVERGRAEGLYPEELDEQLASQFARARKDPLLFEQLARARQAVARTVDARFGRDQIALDSGLPGGTEVHRLVGKAISRQVLGVLQQMTRFAQSTGESLTAILDALDEMKTVVTNDLFGDIDAVHHRLVSVEARLARLEATVDPPEPAPAADDA
jgi:hypothetical protein